jgi:hypothetical protein
MTIESSSNLFVCGSLTCSLLFWLGLILSYFPGSPTIGVSGGHWLAILGIGILLGVVAAVLNFEKKLRILAVALALITFFFVLSVMGV